MCGVLRRAISTKTTAFSKVRLKTANGETERNDKIKEGIKDVVDICNNGTYRRKWGRREAFVHSATAHVWWSRSP